MKKKTQMIVSIDESTTCSGYAIMTEKGELKDYGKLDFKKEKDSMSRLSEMVYAIEDIIEKYNPKCIIIEDILITMNANTARVLLSLQTIIELYCHRKNIECIKYRTTKWRKILGLSNSPKLKRADKKKEALDFINNKLNLNLDNDDTSDAICLGLAYIIERNINER